MAKMKQTPRIKNYLQYRIGALGFVLALGIGGFSHEANAEKIFLDAPPLLWEEQVEAKKVNEKEYYRQKYGSKPRESQTETAKPMEKNVDEGAFPEPSLSKSADITEGFGVGMTENMGTPGVSQGHSGDEGVVLPAQEEVPEQATPPCNYEILLGRKVSEVDFAMFEGRPVRVVFPNQPITMDMNTSRINLKVTDDGIIRKVACF